MILRLQWPVCFCPDVYHSQHFHSSLKIHFPPGIISLQPEELPLAFLIVLICWQQILVVTNISYLKGN